MYRLKLLLVVFLGIALTACGGGPASSPGSSTDDPAMRPVSETGVLGNRTTAPKAVASLITREKPVLDEVFTLPVPGPVVEEGNRTTAALTTMTRAGTESFLASSQAVNAGNGKVLNSSLEPVSWAVYQYLVPEENELSSVTVKVSNVLYGGDHPGYFIGISDYARDRWIHLAQTTQPTYTHPLEITADYRSPNGYVYIYVVTYEGQQVTVDNVGLTVDDAPWKEVNVDPFPDRGWTPAIEFAPNGNPMVAYADFVSGVPHIAIGDSTKDLMDNDNWVVADIDPMIDELVLGSFAVWFDIVIGPTGLPRLSQVYLFSQPEDPENDTIGGFTAAVVSGENLVWLNYRLGSETAGTKFLDSLGFSSIDYTPVAGKYGTATFARNMDEASQPEHDMIYRTINFNDNDPGDTISVSMLRGFSNNGHGWYNPHLRYDPSNGHGVVGVAGGVAYVEESEGTWTNVFGVTATNLWGSLAFNPVTGEAGLVYSKVEDTTSTLYYLKDVDNPASVAEVVDTQDMTAAEDHLGNVNQLCYDLNGNPLIAYTKKEGGMVYIQYAYKDDGFWFVEDVSSDPSQPGTSTATVTLDMAVSDTGIPGICYNHLNNGEVEIRVAIRGG